MKVWISGGSGFVGSHLVRAFDDVCAPTHAEVDVTDADAVRRSIAAYRPDAIVHAAILNDFTRLERDGWRGYVGATRNVVDAARRRAGRARLDRLGVRRRGRRRGHAAQPDQPLRRCSRRPASSGARPPARRSRGSPPCRRSSDAPRSQDAGFGYFVAALVRALRAGETLHGLGGRRHQHGRDADAGADAAAPDRARSSAAATPASSTAAAARPLDRRTLALSAPSPRSGSTASCSPSGRRRAPPFPVPYDTQPRRAPPPPPRSASSSPTLDDQLRELRTTMEVQV